MSLLIRQTVYVRSKYQVITYESNYLNINFQSHLNYSRFSFGVLEAPNGDWFIRSCDGGYQRGWVGLLDGWLTCGGHQWGFDCFIEFCRFVGWYV